MGLQGYLWGLVVLGVLVALYFVRKSGGDSVVAKVEKNNAEAANRVAQAVVDGPHDKQSVVDRLRDPDREL